MSIKTFAILFTIIGLSMSQGVLPKHCKVAFAAADPSTGCKTCDSGYGRKQTNKTRRILQNSVGQGPVTKPNYECSKCTVSNCTACNSAYDSCETCTSKYFPSNTRVSGTTQTERLLQTAGMKYCKRCVSPCDKCTGLKVCSTCLSGYRFIAQSNSCNACTVKNCSTCPDAEGTCTMCKSKFYMDANTCKNCMANCNKCTAEENCSACALDYSFNKDSKECVKKPFFKRGSTWIVIILLLIILGVVLCVVISKKSEDSGLTESLK